MTRYLVELVYLGLSVPDDEPPMTRYMPGSYDTVRNAAHCAGEYIASLKLPLGSVVFRVVDELLNPVEVLDDQQ